MLDNENTELARITTQEEWNAYKKLFEAENRKRGIKAEPLPEIKPELSAEAKLNQTIDKAIQLWQQQQPLQSVKSFGRDIKEAFSLTGQQLQEDTSYYYQNARTYLENTVSGAASIVEDTLGLSVNFDRQNYFIDPADFLGDFLGDEVVQEVAKETVKEEPEQSKLPIKPEPESSNPIDRIIAKGTEDIATVENAICGFLDRFRGR